MSDGMISKVNHAISLLAFAFFGFVTNLTAQNSSELDQFVGSFPAPPPPLWVNQLPATPAWWSNVGSDYNEEAAFSNKWSQLKGMEAKVTDMVRDGEPPIQERRELIRYLSAWKESPLLVSKDKELLSFEIAETYEALGEYEYAAKEYSKMVNENPVFTSVHALAIQYERVDDTNSALMIYKYMQKAFPKDSDGARIATENLAWLSGFTNQYTFKKPGWWNLYEGPPPWWNEATINLPNFTCFEDGFSFIAHNFFKKGDPRKLAKAEVLLSQFSPITHTEKSLALLGTSHAYAEAGDHHRAIEAARIALEQISYDSSLNDRTLDFIASEFEKVGETAEAKEIRDSINQR
jgi:tetratricopeptide (TPR) repeat protein